MLAGVGSCPKWLPAKPTTVVILAWLAGCLAGTASDASESEQNAFRRDVTAALDAHVDIRWENAEFVPALTRLCDVHRVALFVDRRLDPNAKLTATYRDVPLREVIADVAATQQGGLSVLDSVVYLGPEAAAARLRTLAELVRRDLRQLPTARQRTLSRPKALSWQRLDASQDVLASICHAYELAVTNLDDLPHDLWDAGKLPPLRCSDQLCLTLIGFELSFAWAQEGHAIQLVPITYEEAITVAYVANRQTAAALQVLREESGELDIKRAGRKILLHAMVESHERISALISGRSPGHSRRRASPSAADSDEGRRHTLRITEQRLGEVLRVLGDRLELQFAYDLQELAEAGLSLDDRLTFKVRDATLDELLEALCTSAGLAFTRDANRVAIRARTGL